LAGAPEPERRRHPGPPRRQDRQRTIPDLLRRTLRRRAHACPRARPRLRCLLHSAGKKGRRLLRGPLQKAPRLSVYHGPDG
jgi:hypothetical protein